MITRRCLEPNQRRSRNFLGFLELGATAAGRQSLAGAGCGVSGTPAPEHQAHLVPESEGSAGEQQGAFLQPQRGEKLRETLCRLTQWSFGDVEGEPASREKRQRGPQAISILMLIFLGLLQAVQGATGQQGEQSRAGGGQGRQGRTERRVAGTAERAS